MDYRTCKIQIDITKQSPDIALGVDKSLETKQGEDIVLLYAFYKRCSRDTEKALEVALKMLNKIRQDDNVAEIRVA